jgi:hypothetical protein
VVRIRDYGKFKDKEDSISLRDAREYRRLQAASEQDPESQALLKTWHQSPVYKARADLLGTSIISEDGITHGEQAPDPFALRTYWWTVSPTLGYLLHLRQSGMSGGECQYRPPNGCAKDTPSDVRFIDFTVRYFVPEAPLDTTNPRRSGGQWRKLFDKSDTDVDINTCEPAWRKVISYTTGKRAASTVRLTVQPDQAKKYQSQKVVRDSLNIMGPDAALALSSLIKVSAPAMTVATATMIIACRDAALADPLASDTYVRAILSSLEFGNDVLSQQAQAAKGPNKAKSAQRHGARRLRARPTRAQNDKMFPASLLHYVTDDGGAEDIRAAADRQP